MVYYSCCAINCENNETNRPDLVFFNFPCYSSERSWEWVVNLGRVELLSKDKNELWKTYAVCAEHFERHYFTDEQRRKLVYNAVPTIFNHCSHDVDVSLILEALNRIQNGAAAVNVCGEQTQTPAQCKQQLLKDTTSVDSQRGKTKSYRCQMCSEVFLSAHQLFSHELRDHEHVGILQIDHTKKQLLPKYNQCEKVSVSENGVHETNMHDRNPWKECTNLKNSQHEEIPQVKASVTRGTLQKQYKSNQTHTSSLGGKLQLQDGELQSESSDIRGKPRKQDGNQQAHTSIMGGRSQMQGGNWQADTCNIGGKSKKQDGNQQTDICSMRRKLQKQDRAEQRYTCNIGRKSQKPDGDQDTNTGNMGRKSENQGGDQQTEDAGITKLSDSVHQHKIKMHDCESEMDAQNMNIEQERHTMEVLPEVISSPSKGLPLPYKCHVCGEYFGTKCDLFYHDLQVHVGITKPATIKSWDMSFKGAQSNSKEKTTLNKGEMKRKAKNIPEEQQPVKVKITEKQHTDKKDRPTIKNPLAEQVTLNTICETDPGKKPIQKHIMKEKIVQGEGKAIKLGSGKHEHMQKTVEAITRKYPWNKILVERGRESELDEQGGQTEPKMFVVVKKGPQRGEGNKKKSGNYRIDVVTNYVVTRSQGKQLLMNCDGSNKG